MQPVVASVCVGILGIVAFIIWNRRAKKTILNQEDEEEETLIKNEINQSKNKPLEQRYMEMSTEALSHQLIEWTLQRKVYRIVQALELLLDKTMHPSFDINYRSHRAGSPPLVLSAHVTEPKFIRLYLMYGADINATDPSGNTAVHWATRMGKIKNLTFLLDRNAGVQTKNSEGMLPVHIAAQNGWTECLELLFAHSNSILDDIYAKDSAGRTILHHAAFSGFLTIIKFILDPEFLKKALRSQKGANLKLESELSRVTQELLNAQDDEGNSVLHLAADNGSRICIPWLLEHGALLTRNKKGQSPLHTAVKRGHKQAPVMLLDHSMELLTDLIEILSMETLDFPAANLQNVLNYLSYHPTYFKALMLEGTQAANTFGLKILQECQQQSGNNNNNDTQPSPLISPFMRLIKSFQNLIQIQQDRLTDQLTKKPPPRDIELKLEAQTSLYDLEDASQMLKNLDPLWNELDQLLTWNIEFSQVAITNLTSVVEAFAVVSNLTESRAGLNHLKTSQELSTLNKQLFSFAEKHYKILHNIIKSNLSLLTGPLDFILTTPKLSKLFADVFSALSFEQKQTWLQSKILLEQDKNSYQGANLEVNRNQLFENSCGALMAEHTSKLKGELNVRFRGEDGVGPGVRREWFRVLANEMMNADYALFKSGDNNIYQPNPKSYINPDHLSYFQFVGKIIGMAIFHNEILDIHFTRSFYKHILQIPITVQDMENVDSDYYKNLKLLLDNNLDDIGMTDSLSFTSEFDNFGVMEVVDLVPDGQNITVTDENKHEYVQLITQLKMTKAIEQQINSFLQGFHDIIPHNLIAVFNEYELELLISGLPTIDINDWKANTVYTNGYTATSPQIVWFWDVVFNEMHEKERTLLLQFGKLISDISNLEATGSSRVPAGGFKNLRSANGPQPFTISKIMAENQLPTASTCFNMLKLPEYPNQAKLKECLMLSVHYGNEGFGLQ